MVKVSDRLLDLDMVKVLAMLFVLVGHILTSFISFQRQYYVPDFFFQLKEYVYSFHMPAFVAVSGAVYYYVRFNLGKYNNFRGYLLRKIKRLLIPYIMFSILMIGTMWYLGAVDDNLQNFIFRDYILSQDPKHLWYLLMLFWSFVLVRLTDKQLDKYPIIVFPVLVVFYLFSTYIPNLFQINTLCKYFFFFYCGFLFMKYIELIPNIRWYHFVFWFLTSIVMCSMKMPYIITAMCGMIWLYCLANLLSNTKIKESDIFNGLLKNSYGIYLWHPMFIYIVLSHTKSIPINPEILVLVVFVFVLLVSYFLTGLSRTLKIQWFIGE